MPSPPWCDAAGGHFGLCNISDPEPFNSSRAKRGLGQGLCKHIWLPDFTLWIRDDLLLTAYQV